MNSVAHDIGGEKFKDGVPLRPNLFHVFHLFLSSSGGVIMLREVVVEEIGMRLGVRVWRVALGVRNESRKAAFGGQCFDHS